MPHLAPISWLTIMFISWSTIILIMVTLWWHQSPMFSPVTTKSLLPKFNKWQWPL